MIFKLCNNGKSVVGTREDGATISYSIEAEEYKQWLAEGNIPEPEFTQEETIANIVTHFTSLTAEYIEARVQAYNQANGLAFTNIDAFPKYAINPASVHYIIANQFIIWAEKVWAAVRTWQGTLTDIPTEAEWKVVVDGVPF